MKIAVISKSNSRGGGASRFAERLATLLRNRGNEVDHWVKYSSQTRDGDFLFTSGGAILSIVWRIFSYISRKLGYPDIYTPERWFLGYQFSRRNYDVVHVHDTSTALSPFTIQSLSHISNMVWTLHDCSPITAGCIQPHDCPNFLGTCGNCPQLDEWPLRTRVDRTTGVQRLKKDIYSRLNISLVAPSSWLCEKVVESGCFRSNPVWIANGVCTETFRPSEDKLEIRHRLGLRPDLYTIVVSASTLSDEAKGISYALEAVEGWDRDFQLLIVGEADEELMSRMQCFKVAITGYIAERDQLSRYYAAADVHLFTSLAENLPTVVLEMMACGIPTIGFSVGGVPEIVSHESDGWLVNVGDVEGVRRGLTYSYESPIVLEKWSQAARQKIVDNFSEERCVEKYEALYKKMAADKQLLAKA